MFLKNIVKNSIKFYHNFISPLMLGKCRYYPSCSNYMLDAVEHKGALKGLLKGLGRIMRCNPWSKGGYDPYVRATCNVQRATERG